VSADLDPAAAVGRKPLAGIAGAHPRVFAPDSGEGVWCAGFDGGPQDAGDRDYARALAGHGRM